MITIQIGIGGILIGILIGLSIAFFAFWITDRQLGDDFHCGWEAGRKYAESKSKDGDA